MIILGVRIREVPLYMIIQAVRQMVEPIKEEGPVRPIDFIVVGPIDEDHKRITSK